MPDEIFGLHEKWLDGDDFMQLVTRLAVNMMFTFVVVHLVYGRLYGRNEYGFTYYVFNVITFCLTFLLRKVPIELGFALGLFAVFGILRYRTEAIRTRDLTYLFVVIGLAILNGVVNKKVSLAELLLVNVVIVGVTAAFELFPFTGQQGSRTMTYDDMEVLRQNDEAALIADLTRRTGLPVTKVVVQHVDLLRDTAEITVYFETRSKR